MRRLLLVLAVLATGTAHVPAVGARAAAAPNRVPGAVTLEPATGARWLDQQFEAVAGHGDFAKEVLARYDGATASTASTAEVEIDLLRAIGDLDGDGVTDLLLQKSRYRRTDLGPDGYTDLTAYSGRTGAAYWSRRDPGVTFPVLARVGSGQPGVLLIRAYNVSAVVSAVRFVAVGGRRGEVVYDTTVSTADGRGAIQLGGPFDANPRGGTEYLVGRVREPELPWRDPLALRESEPYVLDGATGTMRQVHPTSEDVGYWVSYLAVGDVDGDKRDDLIRVRRGLQDLGTVAALSAVKEKTHWEQRDVPVGTWFLLDEPAQMSGSKGEDVLASTFVERIESKPSPGRHVLLFDGGTGELRFHRVVSLATVHVVWDDVNGDGRADVLTTDLIYGTGKDGVRISVVDASYRVLLRREVVVTPPPDRQRLNVYSYPAGDLDGDGVRDYSYKVESLSSERQVVVRGLLMIGRNRLHATADTPLNGTLDGRGDDRVRVTESASAVQYTVADGWRGPAYWTVRVPTKADNWVALKPLAGARGRCDDVLLYGGALNGDQHWVDVLDGRTGRVRWSRTFEGPRPAGTRPSATGRAATCR